MKKREEINKLAVEAKTNPSAFAELADAMTPLIKTITAKYWVPGETTEDLHQVLRIELWNAVKTYDPGLNDNFAGYAKMCLVSRIKTSLTRKVYGPKARFRSGTRSLDTLEFGHPHSETGNPEKALMLMLARKRLYEILEATLTEFERECAIRKYIFGQSYSEIQRALGKSRQKPIDNALNRARKKLSENKELAHLYADMLG